MLGDFEAVLLPEVAAGWMVLAGATLAWGEDAVTALAGPAEVAEEEPSPLPPELPE